MIRLLICACLLIVLTGTAGCGGGDTVVKPSKPLEAPKEKPIIN